MEAMDSREELLYDLPCGHVFHELCLTTLCDTRGETFVTMKCPTCRRTRADMAALTAAFDASVPGETSGMLIDVEWPGSGAAASSMPADVDPETVLESGEETDELIFPPAAGPSQHVVSTVAVIPAPDVTAMAGGLRPTAKAKGIAKRTAKAAAIQSHEDADVIEPIVGDATPKAAPKAKAKATGKAKSTAKAAAVQLAEDVATIEPNVGETAPKAAPKAKAKGKAKSKAKAA